MCGCVVFVLVIQRGEEKRVENLGGSVEEAQNDLVHAEHDCRTRDRSHEMRGQAAVETHEAFFLPDELEALDQTGVLELAVCQRSLSQTSSRNLDVRKERIRKCSWQPTTKERDLNSPREDRQSRQQPALRLPQLRRCP